MDRRGSYGRNELHRDRLRLSDSFRVNEAAEILTADDATHARQRKVLAHAFSDRALREEHQPLIQHNVDLLMHQLRASTSDPIAKGRVDLANWLNLATFDIIGDLTFGEVFGCLEKGDYHPWVKLMEESVHVVTILSAATQFPWFDWILKTLISRWILQAIHEHHALTHEKVSRRLAKENPRGDFLTQIMKHNGTERELSRDELLSNSMLMIPAGSETSSAGIASCIYNVLAKPEVMRKLSEEVHLKFKSEDEITFDAVAEMRYLDACINEAFRLYPPIAIFNPRVVGVRQGCDVMGAHVPYKVTENHKPLSSIVTSLFLSFKLLGEYTFSNILSVTRTENPTDNENKRAPSASITGPHTTTPATSATPTPTNRPAGSEILTSPATASKSSSPSPSGLKTA